jgi:hypothetical protein
LVPGDRRTFIKMHFTEDEADNVKQWVVKKLEDM